MNLDERTRQWGLYSADGAFVPVTQLNASSLRYLTYSVARLKELLDEKVATERYEQCAEIRDELLRRAGKL